MKKKYLINTPICTSGDDNKPMRLEICKINL